MTSLFFLSPKTLEGSTIWATIFWQFAVAGCLFLFPAFSNYINVHGALAEKYSKTSAQIILRWHIQAGYITIPGSSNPDHIEENFNIFDFQLSDEDMEAIKAIDDHRRYEVW